MNNYDRRWLAALRWAEGVLQLQAQGFSVMYEGELLEQNTKLVIDRDNRGIYVIHEDDNSRTTDILFEGDTSWDHGVFDTKRETLKRLTSSVRVFREVHFHEGHGQLQACHS